MFPLYVSVHGGRGYPLVLSLALSQVRRRCTPQTGKGCIRPRQNGGTLSPDSTGGTHVATPPPRAGCAMGGMPLAVTFHVYQCW